MADAISENSGSPKFSSEMRPPTIEYAQGHVKMYHLSEEKLDAISGSGDKLSLFLTFFGISIGALISLGGILYTTPPDSSKKYAVVVAVTILSAMCAIVFGMLGLGAYSVRTNNLRDVKGIPKKS